MNEEEWLTSRRWLDLWWYLPPERMSERQKCLFATTACRRIVHRMTDQRSVDAIEVCERIADGACDEPDRARAYRASIDVLGPYGFIPTVPAVNWAAAKAVTWLCHEDRYKVCRAVEEASAVDGYEAVINAGLLDPYQPPDHSALSRHSGYRNGVVWPDDFGAIWQHEVFERAESNVDSIHAAYLRDIIGNPFRPVSLDPRWLTSTVVDLARSIYEGFPRQAGGYVALPILADALMDAGCDDEPVLNHCRGPGPHVRGCWVVDLILGKE